MINIVGLGISISTLVLLWSVLKNCKLVGSTSLFSPLGSLGLKLLITEQTDTWCSVEQTYYLEDLCLARQSMDHNFNLTLNPPTPNSAGALTRNTSPNRNH